MSLSWSARRAAAVVDLLLFLTLTALGRLTITSDAYAGPIEMIARSAAITAALMLGLATALGAGRRAYLLASALALPAVITLLSHPAGDRDLLWQLLTNVAVLGAAGMLTVAAGVITRRRERVALALLGVVVSAMGLIAVAGVAIPAWVPAGGVVVATDLVGRVALTAAALLLVVVGVNRGRSTSRRIGLAVTAGSVAQLLPGGPGLFGEAFGRALVLAAAVLVVIAATELLCRTQTPAARRHRAENRSPLTAGMELGAVEAATPVLPQLPNARPFAVPGGAAVGPIVADLALLCGATGQEVQVEVHGDPWVSVDSGGLVQLLSTLLANCARHAPGARVRVRAAARGPRVRIEVIDDGPGFPPGSTARLLRRGVRGPGSTGAGLGLAICTELVERYRGSFTLVSTSSGCTAVVEFPTARHSLPAEVVSA